MSDLEFARLLDTYLWKAAQAVAKIISPSRRQEFDDVLRKALAHAWDNRNLYDPAKGDFAGWLYVVVANLARDVTRHKKTRKAEELTTVKLPANVASPSKSRPDLEMLRDAISSLSKQEQKLIMEWYEEEEDREGLARRYGTTKEYLTSKTHKIRARLLEILIRNQC